MVVEIALTLATAQFLQPIPLVDLAVKKLRCGRDNRSAKLFGVDGDRPRQGAIRSVKWRLLCVWIGARLPSEDGQRSPRDAQINATVTLLRVLSVIKAETIRRYDESVCQLDSSEVVAGETALMEAPTAGGVT